MNNQKLSKVFYIIPAIICFFINSFILAYAWLGPEGNTIASISLYVPFLALLSIPFVSILGVFVSLPFPLFDNLLSCIIKNPYLRIALDSIIIFLSFHLFLFCFGLSFFGSNYNIEYSFMVHMINACLSIVLYSLLTSFLFYFCSDNCPITNSDTENKELETNDAITNKEIPVAQENNEITDKNSQKTEAQKILPFEKYFMIFFPLFLVSSIIFAIYSLISVHDYTIQKDIPKVSSYIVIATVFPGIVIGAIISSLISAIVLKIIHKKSLSYITSHILMFTAYVIFVLLTSTKNIISVIIMILLYLYPLYQIKKLNLFGEGKTE